MTYREKGEQENRSGFTLIEMSIVLVIIGLIVGGVLVGQDLVRAAEVRATITQVEKFNTATNTFRGKFGALPGDLNQQVATQFGFAARGPYRGAGDGNGEIEGNWYSDGNGAQEGCGETVMFWVDLSSAAGGRLIEGGFNTATSATPASNDLTGTYINLYFPQAKLGRGNYFYVYSGNYYNYTTNANAGVNYFGLSAVTSILSSSIYGYLNGNANIPVAEAYAIDKKIDDGMPQSGSVMAWYLGLNGNGYQYWTDGSNATLTANEPLPTTTATAGSSTTCYDNGHVTNATQNYSLGQNNGAGANCALSFKFQ